MKLRNWLDEEGKPWRRRIVWPLTGPAARAKTRIPLGRVVKDVVMVETAMIETLVVDLKLSAIGDAGSGKDE